MGRGRQASGWILYSPKMSDQSEREETDEAK